MLPVRATIFLRGFIAGVVCILTMWYLQQQRADDLSGLLWTLNVTGPGMMLYKLFTDRTRYGFDGWIAGLTVAIGSSLYWSLLGSSVFLYVHSLFQEVRRPVGVGSTTRRHRLKAAAMASAITASITIFIEMAGSDPMGYPSFPGYQLYPVELPGVIAYQLLFPASNEAAGWVARIVRVLVSALFWAAVAAVIDWSIVRLGRAAFKHSSTDAIRGN